MGGSHAIQCAGIALARQAGRGEQGRRGQVSARDSGELDAGIVFPLNRVTLLRRSESRRELLLRTPIIAAERSAALVPDPSVTSCSHSASYQGWQAAALSSPGCVKNWRTAAGQDFRPCETT